MSALVLMMLAQMGQPMQRWMPNQDNGSPAFFEFAPASGAGMGTACACTTPTGAKGETMTFTRTGDATCSKQGLATTGIANGDLVVCTANQPRVESSGGVLGLRVEGARTNSALRSQQIDNAAWVDDVAGVAAPTITADFAVAPDGTTTAERVQLPALGAFQYSLRRQAIAAGSTGNASVYVKGNGTSGSISLATDGSLATATDCAYVAATWTRCVLGTIGTWVFVGAIASYGSTSGTKASQDVFLWGVQTEGSGVATYATSYIPTVASAVTRNAETATLPVAVSQQTQCQAATVELLGTSSNDRIWTMTRVLSGSGDFIASYTQAAARVDTAGSGAVSVTGAGSAFGAVTRFLSTWNGSTLTMFRNATQTGTTTTANTLGPASIIGIGSSLAGASHVDGIVTRVQVDPSPSRCTP